MEKVFSKMTRGLLLYVGICFSAAVVRAQPSGAPTIASISNSQTITEGQNVALTVSVNGTAPFSYQWRKEGTAISGATASTLAFAPIRVADAGTYAVAITNGVGSVTSGPVVLAVNAAVAPTFYYQPSAVGVTVGDTLNLYASVNGTGPLTFVWKRGTTTLATTSSSNFSKAAADATDAGSYTVTVINIAGSVTSNPFTVTVNPATPPTISYGPYGAGTVATGDSIYLYVGVNGTGQITYQWKKDGVAIAGATNSAYSKYNVTAADAGSYTVTATNAIGSTTSAAANVSVSPPVAPTINSISGSVSVAVGESFSLSVYANGTAPFTYQWRKDGVALAGATSDYYSRSGVQATDAGAYSVVVTNAQGSVTSGNVAVSVTSAKPPVITYHPPSLAVRLGDYLSSFSVGVSGTGTMSYQWSKDGTPISGATSSSYYIGHAVTAADAGTYTVAVSSTQGSVTSQPCYLTILPATPPAIGQQPASQTVRQGQSFSFSANISGVPTPTIQWRKDGINISGATNSGYYQSSTASSDAGVYSFVATNAAGSVTSAGATLNVITAAAPQIIEQPASASLLPGDYFYGLYVNVRASANFTVQWYRDGLAIPGATGTSYYISNAQPAHAGTYTAVVTSAGVSATSRDAVITVDANTTRPVITYVQGGRAVGGGDSVTLNISTSSSGETVQWFKDGIIIANATSKSYAFSNFGLSSVGIYTAQVTNASGTFTSRPIALELFNAGVAPLITTQPAGQNAAVGGSAYFGVVAEGEAPLTYQWRKDGVNISGATSSSYSVGNLTSASAGAYSVVVSNRNSSATSSAAGLNIAAPAIAVPVITQHPPSRAVQAGSSYYADFSVGLLDATGVTYQWRKDGTAIAGANSSYYSVSPVTTSSAGRYSVVVTNSAGSATSYDAVLTVLNSATGPTFTTQPQSQAAYYGNAVTFTTAATSSAGSLTYQWRKDGVPLAGAISATLTLTNVQSGDAATYTLIATDANGSTPSTAATLTLSGGVAPYLVTTPTSYTALAGTIVTFTAAVGGTPAPTVQWRKDGVDLAGATSTTLTLSNVQAANAGNYTIVVRNAVGSVTSAAATLTVIYPPPTITAQPVSLSLMAGSTAVFNVTATGLPALTYQWRKDGVNIAGANGASLVLTNVQTAIAGRYSVVVRTDFGTATSVEAVLTVGNPITVSMPKNLTVYIGDTATLSAQVSSVDPLICQWVKNGVYVGVPSATFTIPNAQLSNAGTYVLSVMRPDGTVIYPISGSAALTVTLTVLPRPAPVFTLQPVGGTVTIGGTFTLTVKATFGSPFVYQWQKNGMPLPDTFGDTLVLRNVQSSDDADYRAVAMDGFVFTASNTVHVTVTGSPFAGEYFGAFTGGDSWAMHVNADGTAVFLAILWTRNQAIIARNVVIDATGRFSFGFAQTTAADGSSSLSSRYFSGLVSGIVNAAGGAGSIGGLDPSYMFSGQRVVTNTGVSAGYYQAVPLAADLGEIVMIAGPDGRLLLVAVDAAGVRGGSGRVDNAGQFVVTQPGSYEYRGGLGGGGAMSGTYSPAGGTPVQFTTALPAMSGSDRLANVATRGLTGPDAKVMTAGFVISGVGAKDVLIRAVGPGLATFGVTGTLANPKLRLYKGGAPILENQNWTLGGFASQIVEASGRVGAFPLTAGISDAAVLARLDPGAYTAQITGEADASGVVLVEVYDASTPTPGASRLVNLSTRSQVGSGGDTLIVGIVVGGSATKLFLIRGIGPTLGSLGVSGALADPKLQVYQGPVLLHENDNWFESADAGATATTATMVGAFALPSGSKDAAMLVYLAPGNYTAQVSGVGGTTGIALVEVYEVQ